MRPKGASPASVGPPIRPNRPSPLTQHGRHFIKQSTLEQGKRVRNLALAFLIIVSGCVSAAAQPHTQAQAVGVPERTHRGPDLEAQRAAMERLSGLVGRWRGAAALTFPSQQTIYQTEEVERSPDGLLLLIRGVGYASAAQSDAPIFRAFGVISYDDTRQVYEMRAYNDGRAVTAEARFLEDDRFQWIMDFSPVIVRYTLTFQGMRWREIGEVSRDNGSTWSQTIEIDLARVE